MSKSDEIPTNAPATTAAAPRSPKGASRGAWVAWIALLLAIACAAVALLAGPGYQMGWWSFRAGISALRSAATAAAWVSAFAAICLIGLILLGRSRPWRAVVSAGPALLIALATWIPPYLLSVKAAHVPPIHDITTDLDDPPQFVEVVALRGESSNPLAYSSDKARQQREAYPDIGPLWLDVPPREAFERAEHAVRDSGWAIVSIDPEALRIEATAKTLLFGFKDDVVVRVRGEQRRSRIDVRSVSRVGRGDVGTNAERIRGLLSRISAR